MNAPEAIDKILGRRPQFTGAIELHFHKGQLRDVKSHESHRDLLAPKEQRLR